MEHRPVDDPNWLPDVLGVPLPGEGGRAVAHGVTLVRRNGILRSETVAETATQAQTEQSFGYKWARRETFDSTASRTRMRAWLVERYGDIEHASWWADYRDDPPLVLDAGCGAGLSGIELFGSRIAAVRYLAADISNAVDQARDRFAEHRLPAAFVQADLQELPLAPESVDVAFSEGVLHHTDSTEDALARLVRLVKPGGRVLFYVYRRKGPVREFTDDYIRDRLAAMAPGDAWDALRPLSKLGESLGRLDAEIEIDEPIDVLDIPAGTISVQRLFYWHVAKMFYDPDLTPEEMHHINFDWFAPANAHRQTPAEVRQWCADNDLTIEHERIEAAGITIVARRGS